MKPSLKTWILVLWAVASVTLIFVVIKGDGEIEPLPSPSPHGEVVPTPSPFVQPVATLQGVRGARKIVPAWASSVALTGAGGEELHVTLRRMEPGCEDLGVGPAKFPTTFYAMPDFVTQFASYQGARIGAWKDPLLPNPGKLCQGDWALAAIRIPRGQAAGGYYFSLGSFPVELHVLGWSLPEKPSVPFYMALSGYALVQAHGYGVNASGAQQARVTHKYVALYREHRIEPIQQWITAWNGDPEKWKAEGGSFQQLLIDGALAPPCVLGYQPGDYPVANLKSIQEQLASGAWPKGSWAYVWDEGEGSTQLSATALAHATQVKTLAPLLRTMLTRRPSAPFQPVTDVFAPVFNVFSALWAKPFWLYGSCMAQGNCQNTTQPRPPTGDPMMVIDAPEVHARAYPVAGFKLGAESLLYYLGTQKILTAFTDQYSEGGNGDGTLVYPGKDDEGYPSLRMKLLLEGLQDVEYFKRAGKDAGALIQAHDRFEQDYEKWDALHDAVGAL